MDQGQPLIFISYASLDRERVNPFADALERANLNVWMDHRRIVAGQNWNAEIRRALGKADVVVIFLSKQSVDRRGYAQREIAIALEQAEEKLASDIYLVPVLLDDLMEFPERLKHVQMVHGTRSTANQEILASVTHQLSKLGQHVQAIQTDSKIRWTEKIVKENWDGQPGYDIQYNVHLLSSSDVDNVGDITAIVQGSLARMAALQRKVKFEQNPEIFNFGQKRYQREHTFEAHCRAPTIVEQALSLNYTILEYSPGAAHEMIGVRTFNFTLDPITPILSPQELFADDNQAFSIIQTQARKLVLNNIAEENQEQHPDDKEWINSGTLGWSEFQNFTFSREGIEFHFPPYQVAAFAYGTQSVTIGKFDVYELMHPHLVSALGWDGLRWQREFGTAATS